MTEQRVILDEMIFHGYIEATEQKYNLAQLSEATRLAVEEENTRFLCKIRIHLLNSDILYDALYLAAKVGKLESYKALLPKKSTEFWRKGDSVQTSRQDLDHNYVKIAVINERCDIVSYALNDVGVFIRAHTRCSPYISGIARIPFLNFKLSTFQCEKANATLRKLLLPYLPPRFREIYGCSDATTKYLRPTDNCFGISCDPDKTLAQALSALNQFH